MQDPRDFVEPALFMLQTIISELDFKCPTCRQTIKLHTLPQHREQGCTPVMTTPTVPTYIITLQEPDRKTAAAPSVPVEVQQPPPVPDDTTEQAPMEVPPSIANLLQASGLP